MTLGASMGNSLGNSGTGISTERAPSGLARFFGTSPVGDRGSI